MERLTIDEAIAFCHEKSNNIKLKAEPQVFIQLAEWLEELKSIKEMDLSIPQRFTKEQSDWIKAYCIKRNIEFYNKAIDDFVKLAKEHNWNIRNRNENEFIYGAIDTLAEQLKVGGENV